MDSMSLMSSVSDVLIFGNTLLTYIFAIVIFGVIFGGGLLIRYFVKKRCDRTAEKTKTLFIVVVDSFEVYFYLLLAFWVVAEFVLVLPKVLEQITSYVFFIYFGYCIARAFSWVVDFFVHRYSSKLKQEHVGLAEAVPMLGTIGKIVGWILIGVTVLSNIGFDVTVLIAGLGIGGIAFAFAFQKILTDLFSAFALLLDRPFVVGEFIHFGEFLGTVEHIGLKTTRVRSLSGEELVIPNAILAEAQLRNYTRLRTRRVTLSIPIAYTVSVNDLAKLPVILKEAVEREKEVCFDRATLTTFDKFAILFEVVYYVQRPEYALHMTIQERILMYTLRMLNEAKIELGYPIKWDIQKH